MTIYLLNKSSCRGLCMLPPAVALLWPTVCPTCGSLKLKCIILKIRSRVYCHSEMPFLFTCILKSCGSIHHLFCYIPFLFRGGIRTHALYSSRSTDNCVKKVLVKVEERIQFLYSSTSKKVQPLKCSWRIKVSVPLTEIFCRLVLCKANWTAPHIDTGQRVLISKVESGGFVRAVCECSSCQIPIFWVGKLNVDCQISADMSHLFSPFWSPSLSVSILLRPSHHFVLLRLPCVICTLGRLLAMTQNKHNRYFPSNALKLKWRVCFENVRRRKYRCLCSNVVSKSKKFKWTVK